ncbi:MAG TPA: hypothetical protein DCM49_01035 [Lachnospiraceae bacterium]|nr:hypothetical protein [Lachnospiraceae bacterium]
MQDLDKTIRYIREPNDGRTSKRLLVTIFDKDNAPKTFCLADYKKSFVSFGRSGKCDIVMDSLLVSGEHGRFVFRNGQWVIEDKAVYTRTPSTNGLIYNNAAVVSRKLSDGDFIRIDDGIETISEGVLMFFSSPDSLNRWNIYSINGINEIRIGRDPRCEIVLPHVSISKYHATILYENGSFYIIDNDSANGVIVNNVRIRGKYLLHEKDVITITASKLVFTRKSISFCCCRSGISVDVNDVVITRGKGKKSFITGRNISLNIKPGELVAIVGGSGAGKSTILNCMCGYLPPAMGDVYINGINLYQNFDSLKRIIGYVPQSDIVYDNLTLYDMLSYTAELRLPKDTTKAEKENAISRAISVVELNEKRDSFIKALSGGQRKRASIAVELLSDPNLLFLDEPASGLDPGTERSLMNSLRGMANSGKTVILVTHSTLQLQLCDKIVFMGRGGNLCYFGSLKEALDFFEVPDVVDVYNMITEDPLRWRRKYDSSSEKISAGKSREPHTKTPKLKKRFQLPVLCARYVKLVVNDRQKLLLLCLQAPLLALLISLVADGQEYEQYEMTKSLLFALSCSAFWVGMLNAIQEVCKEKNITKREYMTGLSLTSYILSKILVLGILCLLQSLMIIGMFTLTVGIPEEGLMFHPFPELLITTFLTALASAGMGLFVSSLFTNADRAMTVAPILLMPQILFSGLIFKLDGATETISWFAICRWSMEGYGTTANLNALPLKMQQQGVSIPHEVEDFFDFTNEHMLKAWGILAAFTIVFLILARIVLSGIGKEKS